MLTSASGENSMHCIEYKAKIKNKFVSPKIKFVCPNQINTDKLTLSKTLPPVFKFVRCVTMNLTKLLTEILKYLDLKVCIKYFYIIGYSGTHIDVSSQYIF